MESSVKFKVCAAIPAAEVSAVSAEEVSAPLFAAFPALTLSAAFPIPAVLLPALSAPAAADTLLFSAPLPLFTSAIVLPSVPAVPSFSAAPLPAVSRILPVTPSASAPFSEAPDRPVSSPAAPSVISSCATSSHPFPVTAASSAFSPSESSSSICTEFSSWEFSTIGFVPS